MQIFCQLPNKTIALTVRPGDTIAAVKQQLCDTEAFPPECFRLTAGGKTLEDDTRCDGGSIRKGSTLVLVMMRSPNGHTPPQGAPLQRIVVKPCTGKSIALEVEPSDTIRRRSRPAGAATQLRTSRRACSG